MRHPTDWPGVNGNRYCGRTVNTATSNARRSCATISATHHGGFTASAACAASVITCATNPYAAVQSAASSSVHCSARKCCNVATSASPTAG